MQEDIKVELQAILALAMQIEGVEDEYQAARYCKLLLQKQLNRTPPRPRKVKSNNLTLAEVRRVVEQYNQICTPPLRPWTGEVTTAKGVGRNIARLGHGVIWPDIFQYVRSCPFLTGGARTWQADLLWITGKGYDRIVAQSYVPAATQSAKAAPEEYASGWGGAAI
jgi:hypothetical protein